MVKETCVNEKRDLHCVCRPNTRRAAAKEAHVCQKRRIQLAKVTYECQKRSVYVKTEPLIVYSILMRVAVLQKRRMCVKRDV